VLSTPTLDSVCVPLRFTQQRTSGRLTTDVLCLRRVSVSAIRDAPPANESHKVDISAGAGESDFEVPTCSRGA
jgi:hypothetical protein